MKIHYEKGDKVIVVATGTQYTVERMLSDNVLVFRGNVTVVADAVRPALDTAMLVSGDIGNKVQRLFVGFPDTFLQDTPTSEVHALAKYYDQVYEPEDEANYEVVWAKDLDEVKAAIREANGDDPEPPTQVTLNDGSTAKVGDAAWWNDPNDNALSGNRKITKIVREDLVVLTGPDLHPDDETECDPGDELEAPQLDCDQCGKPMFVNEAGVSHHLDVDRGEVDHAVDADHVALNKLLA